MTPNHFTVAIIANFIGHYIATEKHSRRNEDNIHDVLQSISDSLSEHSDYYTIHTAHPIFQEKPGAIEFIKEAITAFENCNLAPLVPLLPVYPDVFLRYAYAYINCKNFDGYWCVAWESFDDMCADVKRLVEIGVVTEEEVQKNVTQTKRTTTFDPWVKGIHHIGYAYFFDSYRDFLKRNN